MENYSDLIKKTKLGLKWNIIGQFSKYLIQFIFGILIARILNPDDYGLINMVLALTAFSTVFIDSGFSSSIIQKSNIQNNDYNTIFTFNLIVGVLITLTLFSLSSLISNFYEEKKISLIVKFISFIYLIQSTTLVHRAFLTKYFKFKRLNLIELTGLLLAGVVGLILAHLGYSYWSLVIRTLIAQFIISLLLYFFSGWTPIIYFDKTIFLSHWKFSSNILFANIIDQFARRIDEIATGKLFNPTTLGHFSTSKHYAFLGVTMSSIIIKKSFFPLFSILENNIEKFRELFYKIFSQVVFIFSPLFTLLYIYSEFFIKILLGDKWLGMNLYFKLFCIVGFLYVLNQFLSFVINSKGKPKFNLHFELIGNSIRIVIVLLIVVLWDNLKPEYFIIIYIMFILSGLIYKIKKIKLLANIKVFVLFTIIKKNIITLFILIISSNLFLHFFNSQFFIGLSFLFSTVLYLIFSLLFKVKSMVALTKELKKVIL